MHSSSRASDATDLVEGVKCFLGRYQTLNRARSLRATGREFRAPKPPNGPTLVLYDSEREEEVTYRLVTPEESDPAAGLISTVSPIGRSLMGKEAGDEVVVTIPSGSRRFEIRRLKTLHDEPAK